MTKDIAFPVLVWKWVFLTEGRFYYRRWQRSYRVWGFSYSYPG